MPITTGGFEDLVQLSQDTLYYVGPNFNIGNTSVKRFTHRLLMLVS